MKDQILRMLKQNSGYLSGEEISGSLGISRTAVWKHINSLKADGYTIDSQTKTGYRLIHRPDCLFPEEIRENLCTNEVGRNIVYFESVDSTNRAARELADKDAGGGTVVVAEKQTAGKGRLGREWHSPFRTGIWMSVILRPEIAPVDAPKITLAVATAVAKALAEETGLNPGIKWPNDILLNGKKVCGILTEMKADMDRIHYVIVGMGINVNDMEFPEGLRETATSLFLEAVKSFSRPLITAAVLNQLEPVYFSLIQKGFGEIRGDWKKYSVNLGREVMVNTIKETIEGVATDIDQDGLLLVKKADGSIQKITAGDVTMRRE